MKRIATLIATGLLSATAWTAPAVGNFPTVERVEYVLNCARDAQGPAQESVYKCSCVIDNIAKQLSYDQYIEYSTAANAFSIGGERGEVMRGYVHGKEMAGAFRKIQSEARKACFMSS